MNAAERSEHARIEALRAERDAIDARGAILGEAPALDRAGVRLERHFGVLREAEGAARGLEHAPDRLRREQARRAPAQEHADERSPQPPRRLRLEITDQRFDV